MRVPTFLICFPQLKNTYGYLAGACKAKLHLDASHRPTFADLICDLLELRERTDKTGAVAEIKLPVHENGS